MALAAGIVLAGGVRPAGAAAVAAGSMEITRPGSAAALDAGGSATDFGIAVPAGASCPGDSAHRGYHVFSFMVPKGVAPASTTFAKAVPSQYFGFIAFGSYYYGAANTAENTGQIMDVPSSFVWTRLTPQDLFPGGATTATWVGGIACADEHGTITNYLDDGHHLRRELERPRRGSPGRWSTPWRWPGTSFPWRWVLLGVGLLLVVVAVVLRVVQGRNETRDDGDPGAGGAGGERRREARTGSSGREEVGSRVDA